MGLRLRCYAKCRVIGPLAIGIGDAIRDTMTAYIYVTNASGRERCYEVFATSVLHYARKYAKRAKRIRVEAAMGRYDGWTWYAR